MKKSIMFFILMFIITKSYAEEHMRVVGIESGKAGSYVSGNLEYVGKLKDPSGKMVTGQLIVNGKTKNVVGIKLDESMFRVVCDDVYIVEKN